MQGVAKVVFFITLKDIAAFFRSEKNVFIWLLICMISGSFVLNYSYSFARYRGAIYEHNLGADRARYRIYADSPTAAANDILAQISESDFPETDNYQFFVRSADGYTVIGSSYIYGDHMGDLTGIWFEGYYSEIENNGENVCAVYEKLLDYGERMKMKGETFTLDGEEFIIKGVFSNWRTDTGALIFSDKFAEKYGRLDSFRVTFKERLTAAQERELVSIINENIPNARITYPPAPGETGSNVVKANELQYSAIIIMLVVCLVSLIKYWQAVNLPAYTVYWINGATNGIVMRVALCESLLLCVLTYLVGLGLNALLRNFLTRAAPLTLADVGIGFGIFFGTFAVFTLVNTAKICRQFKVTNVRRD